MSNVIEFQNKREENKLSLGFNPNRAMQQLIDMWEGKCKPVRIKFEPDKTELFKRQVKRYGSCSIELLPQDEILLEKCIKEINNNP